MTSISDRDALAARARSLYESGLTLVQVAHLLDLSYGTARSLLLHAGGSPRPRGRSPLPLPPQHRKRDDSDGD